LKKILITGSTGFIGENLVLNLYNEYDIGVIIREESKIPNSFKKLNLKYFIFNGDLENLIDIFNKFNPIAVIHLASFFIAEHNKSQLKDLITSNISFGSFLLEAMKESNIKILINTGTFWQNFTGEKYNPVSLYAATKESFQKIIEYYVQLHKFKVITLKLFDTYGENDNRKKLLYILKENIKSKKYLSMSPGFQEINLTHVNDICEAYRLAIHLIQNKKFTGHKIFFLKNQQSYRLRDIVKTIEKLIGKNLKINWGDLNYRKREVINIYNYKNNLPGWAPKITLEEGLKKIFTNK